MREGIIKCGCGQTFYFETPRSTVECPHCVRKFSTNGFGKEKALEVEE